MRDVSIIWFVSLILVAARSASFDLTEQTDKRIRMTQARLTPMGEGTMTVTFDTEVGAVTVVLDVITAEELVQTNESNIQYTEIEGIEDGIIPYEIKTTSTTEVLEEIMPMELPVADEVIELPEGEEAPEQLDVPEGYEIVEAYDAPPGEGTVDLQTVEVEQTLRYEDIKVNEVSEDFFLLGGEQ